MSELAVLGHLSRDVVAGAPPRPGGGVLYSSRVLARLGADAHAAASCAEADRDELLPALQSLGLPVRWYPSSATTAYSFHYEGDRRIMRQEAVGDPWAPDRTVEAAAEARWVHVAALTRTDFSAGCLEALARGRVLLVDAQGLLRTPDLGPLRTDAAIGDVLRHVAILKLDDEEAETLTGSADPARLRSLGVPEVVLTLGSKGSVVVTEAHLEAVAAPAVDREVDPTGAGDTYAAAYLASRARGADPVDAARAAAAEVAALLSER